MYATIETSASGEYILCHDSRASYYYTKKPTKTLLYYYNNMCNLFIF